MKWLFLVLLCGSAGLFFARRAHALDPSTPLDRYAEQTWSTENGLPQNSVHALLQTSDGFLWLGTEAGLARFDGYQFRVFDRTSAPALPGDDIRCLLEDPMGGLWVGTASGLTRMKRGDAHTFTSSEGVPGGAVKSLVMEAGRVWVLTPNGLAYAEVSAVDSGRARFFQVQEVDAATVLAMTTGGGGGLWVATTQGLRRIVNGEVRDGKARNGQRWSGQTGDDPVLNEQVRNDQIRTSRKEMEGRIDTLAHAPGDETTLFLASSPGIFRLQDGKVESLAGAESVPIGGIRSLLVTAQGTWGTGRTSVSLYKDGRRQVFSAGAELPGSQVTAIFEDRRGTVWIGTNGGLSRYLNGHIERAVEAGEAVLTLFEDRDGDLWVGTETEGVRVLRDRAFQVLDPARQSADNSPTSVVQSGDGSIWVGTTNGGVVLSADSGRSRGPSGSGAGVAQETVLALASGGESPGGNSRSDLWVGTPNGLGLRHDGQWQRYTSADGLADDLVRSLLAARNGAMWIGTQHGLTRLGGLSPVGGARATTMTVAQGLGSNLIGPMLEDADGDLWVGTFGGLSRLHGGVFHNFTTADGLPGNTITALAAGSGGSIWIGTKGQGLARWNKTRFDSFAAARAIPNEIYALLDDGAGSLWMTSEHGIFRVTVQDLDRLSGGSRDGAKSEVRVVPYGTADGLPSVDTAAIGYPSAWRLRDGRLCFVTRRGVVAVDPAVTRGDAVAPPAVLESVSVDDREVTPAELASIAPGPLHFAFSFAGINLAAPQRVQYRYMLEGLDAAWVYAGTRRVAYYTSIPHGRYRFRVSARNELGEWSVPAAVEFELLPHFYQTLWFRLLLGVFVLALGLAAYAIRERTLKSRFAMVSAERNRLAREIHDTLAQSFVAVSMRLEIMAQMLKTKNSPQRDRDIERCREQIDETRTLVRESLAEARRSIWDLRSEGTEAQSLPARLTRIVQDTAAQVPAARMETTGTFRPLDRRVEDELFRIAQEAVTNAIRHAGAQSIRLRLGYDLESLTLEVIDTGRGFDPATVRSQSAGHFGLTGIRERASLIGAEVMLESVIGEGTTVRIKLPLRVDLRSDSVTAEEERVR